MIYLLQGCRTKGIEEAIGRMIKWSNLSFSNLCALNFVALLPLSFSSSGIPDLPVVIWCFKRKNFYVSIMQRFLSLLHTYNEKRIIIEVNSCRNERLPYLGALSQPIAAFYQPTVDPSWLKPDLHYFQMLLECRTKRRQADALPRAWLSSPWNSRPWVRPCDWFLAWTEQAWSWQFHRYFVQQRRAWEVNQFWFTRRRRCADTWPGKACELPLQNRMIYWVILLVQIWSRSSVFDGRLLTGSDLKGIWVGSKT